MSKKTVSSLTFPHICYSPRWQRGRLNDRASARTLVAQSTNCNYNMPSNLLMRLPVDCKKLCYIRALPFAAIPQIPEKQTPMLSHKILTHNCIGILCRVQVYFVIIGYVCWWRWWSRASLFYQPVRQPAGVKHLLSLLAHF
uniref:Uncharacterized protein n=1 Tax=Glossina pallidipes TaxID=7398 RepID=A0A1B0ADR9_GLOPL